MTTATPPTKSPKARGPIYNVYSQEIDPTNMMPPPNQNMSPGQRVPLSTARVQSSIPKGGTDSTWLYPSPQMFWNSLVRKGKADGVVETDVDMVIAIHNEMNERTWKQLLTWEEGHKSEHLEGEPALRRFTGNPYKLSPKAQLKSVTGFGFPFDRHDWYVDRGGKLVHYVIDYYFNPAGAALAETPEPFDASAKFTRQIYVDVRPAVESLTDAVDRLTAFPSRALAATRRPRFVAEGLDPSKAPKEEEVAPQYSSEKHSDAPKGAAAAGGGGAGGLDWAAVDAKCGPLLAKLQKAGSEDERRSTSIAFNYCMGRQVCPAEAGSFMAVLEATTASGREGEAGGAEEKAFEAMTKCVAGAVAARPRSLPPVHQVAGGAPAKLQ